MTDADTSPPAVLPDGDYAIVEVLGHRTLIGRVTEVQRFGATLMGVEPIYQDRLLERVLIGGASIYQFTPCSREVAHSRQAKYEHQLPPSVQLALPPAMLAAPPAQEEEQIAFCGYVDAIDLDPDEDD